MEGLAEAVAVVTGGGSGIGRGLCLALAESGACVVAADVDDEAAEAVAAEIRAGGGRGAAKHVDVRDPVSVQQLADDTFTEFGPTNLLFNNAGVIVFGPIVDARPSDWEWLLSVNVMGVAHGISAFLPQMREAGSRRHVVNTASVAGLGPRAGVGVYSATKSAIVAMSLVLREELAEEGIGVSAFCPASVESRLAESDRVRPRELREDEGHTRKMRQRAIPDAPQTMSALTAAELVLRGIRDDVPLIMTDATWNAHIEGHMDVVQTALKDVSSRDGARKVDA